MADIFISYSQKDRDRVRPIANALEARGLDVFWDPEIPPGETWDAVIARHLKAARCVVVVWSVHSRESDWVKEEAEFGKQKRLLVPVAIDSGGAPLGFTRIQTADLSHWTGDPADVEWRKVLDRILHHGSADGGEAAPQDPRETGSSDRLRDALRQPPPVRAAPTPAPRPAPAPRPTGQPVQQPRTAAETLAWQQQQGLSPASPAPSPQQGMTAGFVSQSTPASAPASPAGFDFMHVFFKPTGRIGKGTFWKGFAILWGASFVLGFILGMVGLADLAGLVNMATIYPTVCLFGKRLHDNGKSAWLYAAGLGGSFVVGVGVAAVMSAQYAGPDEVMIGTTVAMLLVFLAFTIWVGTLGTDPATNKHGPPPGAPDVKSVFS